MNVLNNHIYCRNGYIFGIDHYTIKLIDFKKQIIIQQLGFEVSNTYIDY